jgi:Uma2 family endonuclease
LYERHGVKEYWLVDPGNRYIHVYLLDENGKYPFVPEIYLAEESVESTTLKGLTVDLGRLFLVL